MELDRGADGAQGVVLVARVRAEDRNEPFGAEALDRAAVSPHGRVRGLEHAREPGPQRLGVVVPGEIGRQHRDDAALADDGLRLLLGQAPPAR